MFCIVKAGIGSRQRPAAFPSGAIQNERSALAQEFIECRISCFRMKKMRVPTLVVHGSDDQIAPIEICGNLTANSSRTPSS
jgi:dipeptidyl aminopeptidase/acylaminoacyl peptidase